MAQQVDPSVNLERGPCSDVVQTKPLYLVDILALLWRRRRLIGLFTGVVSTLAFLLLLTAPAMYTADAALLPPRHSNTVPSLLSFAAAGGVAGSMLASQLESKSITDTYIAILTSRSTADAVIAQNRLMGVYHSLRLSDARKRLAKHTRIEAARDSLIHISVEDRDPKRAVDLTNTYIEELNKTNSKLAVTEAAQSRAFFEQQVAREKAALFDSESDLNAIQESTGIISPNDQADVLIRAQAEIKAQIANREVERRSMLLYETEQNPQIELLRKQIAAYQLQLGGLESQGRAVKGNMVISGAQLPKRASDYARALRNYKYHEMLCEMLGRYYEESKLNEYRAAPAVQVIDWPVRPDIKSWPPIPALTTLSALVAFFLITGYCILAELLRRILISRALIMRFAPSAEDGTSDHIAFGFEGMSPL